MLEPIYSSDALPDGDFEVLDNLPVGEVVQKYPTTFKSSRVPGASHSFEEGLHSTVYRRAASVCFIAVPRVDE